MNPNASGHTTRHSRNSWVKGHGGSWHTQNSSIWNTCQLWFDRCWRSQQVNIALCDRTWIETSFVCRTGDMDWPFLITGNPLFKVWRSGGINFLECTLIIIYIIPWRCRRRDLVLGDIVLVIWQPYWCLSVDSFINMNLCCLQYTNGP